jgi:hypothetical protein
LDSLSGFYHPWSVSETCNDHHHRHHHEMAFWSEENGYGILNRIFYHG